MNRRPLIKGTHNFFESSLSSSTVLKWHEQDFTIHKSENVASFKSIKMQTRQAVNLKLHKWFFFSRYTTGENLKSLALADPELWPFGIIYRQAYKIQTWQVSNLKFSISLSFIKMYHWWELLKFGYCLVNLCLRSAVDSNGIIIE